MSRFIVGFTAQDLWKRRSQYGSLHGFQHFVVISDGMTRADALNLEGWLQGEIKADRRHTLYRKYCADRRDGRHYPSFGNTSVDPNALVHKVYLAWIEE